MSEHLVPVLHDLAVAVAAPAILLSRPDGQVPHHDGPAVLPGWYVDDVRLLSELAVSVDGSDLDLVRADTTGASRHAFTWTARQLGGWLHDPVVTLDVVRTLTAGTLVQEVTVEHRGPEAFLLRLHVDLAADLAPMAEVRQGHVTTPLPAERTDGGLRWSRGDRAFSVALDPAPASIEDGRRVTWEHRLEPGSRVVLRLVATHEGRPALGPGLPPGATPPWGEVTVEAPDARLPRLVAQSLEDLGGLLLRDGDDVFAAAGAPWFLTLFGRDSLWVARLLVPYTTDLALSTLRVLARRQGTREDPAAEEQPGKILHELRGTTLELGGMSLPPLYYGTVDATPLFVCTLADAWRWGGDPEQVRALLPAARRCLEWMLAQSRESGWLRYVDATGRGLANQGWKDSVDSVQFADGRLAEPPVALCEVQGYAYEAAVRGAALLAAFGEPPVPGLEEWAASLRSRFADAFWVDTPEGGHVAIALDGSGARVDSVTSNMGHLLGTGLLDADRAARVAALLGDPDLDSGFGLRTLTRRSPRFSRLSYHGGSVWPHDTAVAVRGLAAEGHLETAAALTAGVVAASEGVAARLPELYGGDQSTDVPQPVAYPAACRPQAWAAAAPLACLAAVTGLDVDVPAGRIAVPERTSTRLGPFTLRGIRVGERTVDVEVDPAGAVRLAPARGGEIS